MEKAKLSPVRGFLTSEIKKYQGENTMQSQLDHIMKDPEISNRQKIGKLLAGIAPYHDASTHNFTPHPDYPAFCKHCGWIDPDVKDTLGCTHTVYEHALMCLSDLEGKMLTEIMLDVAEFLLTNAAHQQEEPQEEDPQVRRQKQWRWQ